MAEIEKKIISNEEITVLRVTGKMAAEQIIDELTRFYEEEFTSNLIWDFSKAEGRDLLTNDLHKIVAHSKEYGHLRKKGKTAFVISTSLGFGLGRMYDSLAQVADHPVKYAVFRSYDEAISWINSTETD